MSEEPSRVIGAWIECFPEESSLCQNEQVCKEGQKLKKCFERSNELDTTLYKNIPFYCCSRQAFVNLHSLLQVNC